MGTGSDTSLAIGQHSLAFVWRTVRQPPRGRTWRIHGIARRYRERRRLFRAKNRDRVPSGNEQYRSCGGEVGAGFLLTAIAPTECAEGWVTYETMVDMYLTYSFTPSHRGSLLRKLTLLRGRLEESDGLVYRRESQTTVSFW